MLSMTSANETLSRLATSASSFLRSKRFFDLVAVAILFVGFAGQGIRYIVGFYSSGIVLVILFIAFIWAFAHQGASFIKRPQPVATLLYTLVCVLSIGWSQYPFHTAVSAVVTIGVTLVGLMLAAARTMDEIIDLLIRAFQSILAVSFLFELFVSLFWKAPLPPLTIIRNPDIPQIFFWSENRLFSGGPIQGFMGNRNPLAFVAVLLIICLMGRLLQGRVTPGPALAWIGLAGATMALTRSGTVTMCLLAVAGATLAFAFVGSVPERARPGLVLSLTGLAMVIIMMTLFAHEYVASFLGRSSDFSGRGDIWRALLPMWLEHPMLGWGWTIGYPIDHPVFEGFLLRADGLPTTQAHNAYFEALFETGIVGAFFVFLAVATVLLGTYVTGVRRIDTDRSAIIPALLATALGVQSTVESRLLFEGNWILFVVLAAYVAQTRPFVEHIRKHHRPRAYPAGTGQRTFSSSAL